MGIEAAILGSAVIGGLAANKAASTQANAANRAADLQREQFNRQQKLQAPFREAGIRALPELEAASRYTPFGMDQFQADPGYAFRLSEGQKALDRQAAARSGLMSGGALKAAQRYGQEMGSQEYTNAFNRYQAERQARLGPLQSLTGMGQTTAQQIGAAGQNYAGSSANIAGNMASNVGEAYQGAANARASGYLGQANALAGGLGTYLNYSQGQNMVNAMRGGGGGYTPTTDYSTGANYGFGSGNRL